MSTIRFIAEPPDLAELIGYRTDHAADLFRVDDIRPIAFALRNRRGGAGLLRSDSTDARVARLFQIADETRGGLSAIDFCFTPADLSVATNYLSEAFHLTTQSRLWDPKHHLLCCGGLLKNSMMARCRGARAWYESFPK
jgi:hypothetical protein